MTIQKIIKKDKIRREHIQKRSVKFQKDFIKINKVLQKELIEKNPVLRPIKPFIRPVIKVLINKNPVFKTDAALNQIAKKLSFTAFNPINVKKEMKKFSKNTSYNPIFEYSKYKEDLDAIIVKTAKIKTQKGTVGKIHKDIKEHYIKYIELLKSRGEGESFTKLSVEIYGKPNEEILREAKKLLKLGSKREKKIYTTKDVVNKFRFAFLIYGFPWTVEEKDMVVNATVKPASRKILIKKRAKFSKNFVKRLIVHEIGTHAVRAENGAMQPYTFFRRGFPGYLTTEEGLAVINEELNNCLDNAMMRIYAGRVVAVDAAMNHSFAETYEILRKNFGKKDAMRLTYRVKRGLSDTSQHGTWTKDISYLKGYIEIKKYLNNGGDVNKLYYGKIGLEYVDCIDKISGLINPVILPMFRHTNFLLQHFSRILKSIIFLDMGPGLKFINRMNRKFRWL